MLGAEPLRSLGTKRSDRRDDMIIVSQKSLELYEWSKYKVSTLYLSIGLVAFFVVLGVSSLFMTIVFPSAEMMGFVVIASVIGAILAPALLLYKRTTWMHAAKQDRSCQLLARWERYTPEKASDFPMSELARQLKVGSAKQWLEDLQYLYCKISNARRNRCRNPEKR